jgi:radical SAM superfamily enzyme YgiQ (UPF0313 family)
VRIRLIQPPLVQPRYRQLTLPVVGALLAAQGLEVEACDENVEPLDLSPVDLVGVTCHVYNAPRAFAITRRFRARGVPVVLGGTFPTLAPALCAPHADAIVVGELEGQAAALAADAREGRLRPLYRADAPPSLARTVRPDWSLLHADRYLRFNFPLELSRGCRFRCRFCTADTLFPGPRTRSLAEIERDLSAHDHGLVELVDVNFLADAAFFRSALPLLARAPVPGWLGQTTVLDLARDPALPERLAASRCRAVFVGLESLSRPALRTVRKSWSRPEPFLEVARRLREAGVLVQVGLIVGLDEEEPGALARTADLLEEAQVQSVTFTHLHYYPGTPPFEALRREGRLLSEDLTRYDGNHAVIRPLGRDVEALEEELDAFLARLYASRSIGRRAAHAGMARAPAQLLHHLFVNGAVSSYYRERRANALAASRRYLEASRPAERLERLVANLGSRILDRLLAP